MTMFRGATVTLIYNRTLSLKPGVYDESAAITLQSSDVDAIADCIDNFNEIWARLLEVAIGIFLLARQLGWVCVTPLVVVGLSTGGSSVVARFIGGRQRTWMGAVQRRVAITSSLLSEMKAVKMMGLSKTMATIVQEERIRETELMKGFRWMIVWLNVVANVPWAWAPAATFAVYSIQAALRGSNHLDTNHAFTSLAIISLVTDPAARLLSALPRTTSGIGCFDRIQQFLLATSRTDQRSCPEESEEPTRKTGYEVSKRPTSVSVQARSDSELGLGNIQSQDPNIHLGNLAVLVEAADIRPAGDAEIILHDISLRINRSSIVMVVGPVGAGKSTLLRAILGEVPCSYGRILVMTRNMAYCAQTPWLPNTTVREAICGPTDGPVDDGWYQAVVHACALHHDIVSLPNAHQTRIGSRGIVLSGGQKQRIALARAVYSRSKVFILDDVLSALDKRTERTVVDRVFGPEGLIRELGSTVVLVTHASQHLPLADKIVVLSVRGEIIQQGTYEEVKTDNAVIRTLRGENESTNIDNEMKAQDSKPDSANEESDEAAQDLARQTGDMAIYHYYFKSIGLVSMSMFLFFVTINVFCSTFGQIWLKWWTDVNGSQIGLYSSVYFLLALFNSLSHIGYVWAICVVIAPSTARKLHLRLLQTVMRAPQSLFTETETGSLLNRFSQDMTLIEGQLPSAVLVFVSNLFVSLADTALISVGSTWMALTIPAVALIIYILQHVYLRTSRQLRFLDLETRSPVYSHFLETLDGLSTIQAFGWEQASKDVSIERLDASQKPYYLLYCIQVWLTLVLDLIAAALAIIVVSLALNLRGSTSAGLLGVSLNSVLMFNASLSQFISGWTMLETSLGAIARLRSFEAETAIEAKEGEDVEPPLDWPSKGAIDFQNVTASHNPSATALHSITFQISPGQKIGICGRTGSGKSSLVSTILRILEIDSGTLLIDGISLATLPRETIRSRLITMPQDPIHLTGSIRLNADPSLTATDAQIIDALTKVHLWETLQERTGSSGQVDLDADINMHTLSVGQQQLFALGRAMLQKSVSGCKVLLLDEATSSVDAATDQVMQRVIREEFKGVTILSVAHRVETLMDADRVVVLDGGRVVELGEPEELVRRGGDCVFRRLVGR